SNIHITGNSVSDVREVALYSEFAFEAAVIANNIVDGAAVGVSVCNFNEGGRIAVVQGNIIRNLIPKRPIGTAPDDDAGVGVYVVSGAGTALVNNNMIAETPRGAVVGLDHARAVTSDLSVDGAQRFAQLVVGGNAVRR